LATVIREFLGIDRLIDLLIQRARVWEVAVGELVDQLLSALVNVGWDTPEQFVVGSSQARLHMSPSPSGHA